MLLDYTVINSITKNPQNYTRKSIVTDVTIRSTNKIFNLPVIQYS